MAGRPLGRKNLRSYLAADELQRLQINPIEEALKCIKELDEVTALNIKAFNDSREVTRRSDPGPAYLANAIKAMSEKIAIYLKFAEFQYPKISAIAIKDIRAEERSISENVISAMEIRQAILDDPFAVVDRLPVGFATDSNN